MDTEEPEDTAAELLWTRAAPQETSSQVSDVVEPLQPHSKSKINKVQFD